ncbi:MAG: hypothetical protein HY055_06295 [Magnetospirillum sp.]|nr:hypothetical protein [Magnetospirillum sp.]
MRRRFLGLPLGLLGLSLALTACGDVPQPFRHEGINAAVAPRAPRGVVVRPADDGPTAAALAQAIVKRLVEAEVPASTREVVPGAWVIAAETETRIATKTLRWTLTPPGADSLGTMAQSLPTDVWAKAGPATIDRMADEVVAKLSGPLHGEIALPAPSGSVTAARAPVVRLEPLSGLPGDGDKALGDAMRRALNGLGVRLQGAEPDFILRGRAALTPGKPGEDMLEVAWIISNARTGEELGKAAQQGAVPKGRLAGPWGSLAGDIAAGGAEGIADIITAQSQK